MTVSIGIPAYNEEANIIKLLKSIASQSIYDDLTAIYLVLDGVSDNTLSLAKSVNLSKLVYKDYKSRKGKSERMINLFEMSDEDVLVLLDADIVLSDKNSLKNLIKPILHSAANLTSGKPKKINTLASFDKIMGVSMYFQDYIKENLNHSDNVYACHGRLVALSRTLYKKLDIPATSVGNDAYLYFFNKHNNGKFVYVKDASSSFLMPQNFRDFLSQRKRFSNTHSELISVFGNSIKNEYSIPLLLKIKCVTSYGVMHPILLVKYFIILFRANLEPSIKNDVIWETPTSTKKI